MEFKDKLKALRKERQLSQQQLANAIFVSRSAVAKWENGLGIPNDSSYNALLDFFGLTEEELPLNNEIENISISKNKKIHTLTYAVIIISLILLIAIAAILIAILAPQDKAKGYDWDKVDALLEEIGEENNTYWPDGSLADSGKMIEIYHSKDASAETFVRLTKIYRDNADDYYKLLFDRHYYDLVEGKIVTASYSCSFHYQGDVVYDLELADIDYFSGNVESVDALVQCATYQVTDKKFEGKDFISCLLEPVPQFGGAYDPEFHLPDGDQVYIEEIMRFGFEKTTEFFSSQDLPTPY